MAENEITMNLGAVTAYGIAKKHGFTGTEQEWLDSLQGTHTNLLDNWYFANPVNQRGQTEYTGRTYCIDRWRHNGASITSNLTDDGLRVSYAGAFDTILEQLENSTVKELRGKQLTLSILVKSVESGAVRFQIYGNISRSFQTNWIESAGLASVTFTMPDDYAAAFFRVQSRDAGTIVTVKAVKLEVGANQTLAHQENGIWVLNEIPNYAEELAKCQRYYRHRGAKATYGAFGIGNCLSTTIASINVPRNGAMRTQPSVSVSGSFRLMADNSRIIVPEKIEIDQVSDFFARLKITASGLTAGQTVVLQANNDGNAYISESAEL